jgi:hypothetical protein
LQIATHFCADYTSLRTSPFHVHAIVTSRQIPGIFCVDIWLQGDAANIANFPCSSALMSPM